MAAKPPPLSRIGGTPSGAIEELLRGFHGELLEATTDEAHGARRYRWAGRRGARIRQLEAEVGPRGKAQVLDIERPMAPEELGEALGGLLHELRALVARESLSQPSTVHPGPSGERALGALARIGASTNAAELLHLEVAARDHE